MSTHDTWNGDRLRRAREALGILQADAAKQLGVSEKTISRWESGPKGPVSTRRERVEEFISSALAPPAGTNAAALRASADLVDKTHAAMLRAIEAHQDAVRLHEALRQQE